MPPRKPPTKITIRPGSAGCKHLHTVANDEYRWVDEPHSKHVMQRRYAEFVCQDCGAVIAYPCYLAHKDAGRGGYKGGRKKKVKQIK